MATPRLTTEEFIRRSKEIHGDRYSYRKVVLDTVHVPVTIICSKHGEFQQKPGKHLHGHGCRQCGRDRQAAKVSEWATVSRAEFLHRARAKFGNTFRYRGQYVDLTTGIQVKCPTHGWFNTAPQLHLRLKTGCPDCGRNRPSTEEFTARAAKVHGSRYDYSQTRCTSVDCPITVICKMHGMFTISQRRHLAGRGCPGCSKVGHSKIAMVWLHLEIRRRRMRNVQHAENGGEYKIPGTKFRVDGYHPRTNTVFEFYGDMYHGNMSRYRATARPNPYSNLTTRQLHQKTMERENLIRSLGYNVVSVWESDFKRSLRALSERN